MPGTTSGGGPRTPTAVALACAGGVLGGLARLAALELGGGSPTALAAVNVGGSLLLGLLVGALSPWLAPWLRPLLGTGLLGGFTTYSAAMAAVVEVGEGAGALAAGGYLLVSLVLSVAAAALGLALGRARAGRVSS